MGISPDVLEATNVLVQDGKIEPGQQDILSRVLAYFQTNPPVADRGLPTGPACTFQKETAENGRHSYSILAWGTASSPEIADVLLNWATDGNGDLSSLILMYFSETPGGKGMVWYLRAKREPTGECTYSSGGVDIDSPATTFEILKSLLPATELSPATSP